ncbi:hypothetical protein ACWFQ8_18415 [Streptomyces sp. NPDC055254]
MKTHLAAALGFVVLTAGTLLGAPAAAGAQTTSYPTTSFDVTVGASYARGTLTWYNRSVGADGELRAVGCHRMWLSAYGTSGNDLGTWSTRSQCDGTYPFHINMPGGATSVRICLDDAHTNALNCEQYNRP